MNKAAYALLFFLASCSSRVSLSNDPTVSEYQILHTNDFHSQYQSFKPSGLPCNFEEEKKEDCFGGMSRLVAKVDEIRRENSNVLVVDVGDLSHGSLFSKVLKGKPASWFANRMGYDVQSLGNHEFDEGRDSLFDYLKVLHTLYVSSNVDFSNDGEIDNLVETQVVINKGGQRTGVVGILTDEARDIVANSDNIKLLGYKESIEPILRKFRDQGVKQVILLSHIGYEEDLKIASQVCGVDVIIGGHSHTFLSNTDSSAEGSYPTIVASSCKKPVAIVTAASRGKYLGSISVAFDSGGIITKAKGEPILIDSKSPEDKEAKTELTAWLKEINKFYQKIVGYSDIDFPVVGDICRFRECAIGDLVADALLWMARDKNPDFAVVNAGAIRGGIGKGPIPLATVYETLPFNNKVSVFRLKGSTVKAMLEHGVSRAENSTKKGTGRFLQFSGLKIIWDVNNPVGERIKEVFVIKDGKTNPLHMESYYTVVAPDFIRNGGDGFMMLKNEAVTVGDIELTLAKALINFLQTKKSISITDQD